MSRSRGSRIKALRSNPYEDPDVFYMSLEEAKNLISSKFEFDSLAERHERQRVKRMRTAQG
jgi:hypothetical protein